MAYTPITSDDLNRSYDDAAPKWHASIMKLGYGDAYARLVDALPQPSSALQVLDVGCGSGAFAEAFLKARSRSTQHMHLLDPSQEMLRRAETLLHPYDVPVTCHQDGIGSQNIANGGVDTVLCAHVIEHLDDPASALTWLRSRLTSQGKLALSVSKPHWCTAILRWKWGHKAYRPREVEDLLHGAGFSQITRVPFQKGPPSRTSMGYVAS
ncbi:class I SAM-dependent DNA methyltransferase [Aliiroseovarius sp. 2305UL8-7]|uniref:class I SAM-dependent DNA methyltransferase n=1 Tax=Aliiroseovarius conchicola TaxID=3121637 RepID=UPI003528736A